MRVEFVECDSQDHLGAVETSLNRNFDFIEQRLADEPFAACIEVPMEICSSDPRAHEAQR